MAGLGCIGKKTLEAGSKSMLALVTQRRIVAFIEGFKWRSRTFLDVKAHLQPAG
jgi:hypothetical protein